MTERVDSDEEPPRVVPHDALGEAFALAGLSRPTLYALGAGNGIFSDAVVCSHLLWVASGPLSAPWDVRLLFTADEQPTAAALTLQRSAQYDPDRRIALRCRSKLNRKRFSLALEMLCSSAPIAELDLTGCGVLDDDFGILSSIGESFRWLCLHHCKHLTNRALKNTLRYLPNLSTLDLTGRSDLVLDNVGEHLAAMPSLEELLMSDEVFIRLCTALSTNTTLRSVRLNARRLTADALRALANVPQLLRLTLEYPDIPEDMCDALAPATSRLECLTIVGNPRTMYNVASLPRLTALRELRLDDVSTTTVDASVLENLGLAAPQLAVLSLNWWASLQKEHYEAIGKNFGSLETLNLERCNAKDENIVALSPLHKTMKALNLARNFELSFAAGIPLALFEKLQSINLTGLRDDVAMMLEPLGSLPLTDLDISQCDRFNLTTVASLIGIWPLRTLKVRSADLAGASEEESQSFFAGLARRGTCEVLDVSNFSVTGRVHPIVPHLPVMWSLRHLAVERGTSPMTGVLDVLRQLPLLERVDAGKNKGFTADERKAIVQEFGAASEHY